MPDRSAAWSLVQGATRLVFAAGCLLVVPVHGDPRGQDLLPIDPQGEVAARLATLLGDAPARIYPLGRDGFLHRGTGGEAGTGLFCANLGSGTSRRIAGGFSVILDVQSDEAETTAVLVRFERDTPQVSSSTYRVYLVMPDCEHRALDLLTATRDPGAAMCARGLVIGVDRAVRVLGHELVMRNGRMAAIRLEVEEHDCATGEGRRRWLSRPLARAGASTERLSKASWDPDESGFHCYCD